MNLILEVIIAAICSVGFAIVFNCPKRVILGAGLCGGFGWMIYLLTKLFTNSLSFAALFAAIGVGLLGEALAHLKKTPATVFIIPGIIPLVPGYGLYYTMLKVIEYGFNEAATIGFEAIFIAISIASGLVISSTIGKVLRKKVNRFS